jgi:kynurenine 3-monooxygenase
MTIVGGGLAGALLATLLAQRGWSVDVYERRGDPRVYGYAGGRSINLALAERGLHALRQADADQAVMAQAVMMRGRFVHPLHGEPGLQRYGRDDSEVIWSINRGELNIVLLDIAESHGARLHFDQRLDRVDFAAGTAVFKGAGTARTRSFRALVGADGAGSTLRGQIAAVQPLGERTEWLDHGYKELEIPPAADGDFRIEPNALHIWPRGHYMCIALPNDERTFTVTLFMPHAGAYPSFELVQSADEAQALFERDFPDTLPLIPDLRKDYEANPVGLLGTLYLDRWHLDGRAVLIGDAAHAMVPFHGQGMNCAFEDCVALADHLDRHAVLFQQIGKCECHFHAVAVVAIGDRIDDRHWPRQRELQLVLCVRTRSAGTSTVAFEAKTTYECPKNDLRRLRRGRDWCVRGGGGFLRVLPSCCLFECSHGFGYRLFG